MKKLLLLFTLTIIFSGASAQDFVFKNMIDRLSISKDGQGINIIGNDIRDNLGNYFLKSSTGQVPNEGLFVHLAGTETITGAKTFTSQATFTSGLRLNTDVAGLNYLTGLSGMGPIGNAVFVSTGAYAAFGVGSANISDAHFLTSWGYTKVKSGFAVSDDFTGVPSINAGIQLFSTTKGIQTSNMTYAQRTAIGLESYDANTGLLVFQKDAGDKGKGLYTVLSGSVWDRILTTADLAGGGASAPAADNTVVHLDGTETITGMKSFSTVVKMKNSLLISDWYTGWPSPNAGIQLLSTTKGIQTSSMTYAQRNAIYLDYSDGNTGMTVYQQDDGDKGKGLYTVMSGRLWDRILTTADLGGLGGASPAADGLVVHLAGTETITGAKTFSSAITGSSNLLIADSYTGTPSANAGIQLMSTTKGFQTSSMSYAQRNAINLDNYDGNTGLMVYQQDPGDRGKGLYTVKTGREWERILTTSDLSNGTIPPAGIQNQYGGPQTGNAWVSGMIRADVGMITGGIAATNLTITGVGSVGVKNFDGTMFTDNTYNGYVVYNTNVDGGYSRYGKAAINWNNGGHDFIIQAPNFTKQRNVVFPDRSGTIVVADGNGCIVTANKVMTADGKEIFKTPNGSWKYVHVGDDGSRLVDNATVTFDSDNNAYVTIP